MLRFDVATKMSGRERERPRKRMRNATICAAISVGEGRGRTKMLDVLGSLKKTLLLLFLFRSGSLRVVQSRKSMSKNLLCCCCCCCYCYCYCCCYCCRQGQPNLQARREKKTAITLKRFCLYFSLRSSHFPFPFLFFSFHFDSFNSADCPFHFHTGMSHH